MNCWLDEHQWLASLLADFVKQSSGEGGSPIRLALIGSAPRLAATVRTAETRPATATRRLAQALDRPLHKARPDWLPLKHLAHPASGVLELGPTIKNVRYGL